MASTTDDETPKNLNDAHALIQHAMENVKQELLIIDKSGKSHLVIFLMLIYMMENCM
ncbi:head vertex assembly chaperone [Aeromonas phage phiAS4]|uniref:Initiator of head vertex n=1 Tax=Aeromonas phage phiAS4 TaxID=879628 RepID=E1A1U4_9CAUD|nr:head vertex assembly chaperone [Aeromonas phage phiAS4]ADM79818.1 initiator of head vertex [Aeromonas phage phiAS4]